MKNFLFSKKDMERCVEDFRILKENFEKRKVDEKPSIDLESIKKSINLFLKWFFLKTTTTRIPFLKKYYSYSSIYNTKNIHY